MKQVLAAGLCVGAWKVLSRAEPAEYHDGKARSRWWCRCACGRREAVFDRDLKCLGGRPPRRRSCGAAACKSAWGALNRLERARADLVELLLGHGIDALTADDLAERHVLAQRARLERELRAPKIDEWFSATEPPGAAGLDP